ncbi:AraC family transcriptional regulator [Amycolatopsis sp. A1MSW2902]
MRTACPAPVLLVTSHIKYLVSEPKEAAVPAKELAAAPGQPLRFRTDDLDAAREEASRAFVEHDVRLSGRLDFRLDLAPGPRLTLSQIAYGADAVVTAPPMRDCYDLNLPVSGTSTAEQSGARQTIRAGQSGATFLPDAPLRVRWSADARQYVLKIPKPVLDNHAAKLAGLRGSEGIRFDLTFDLHSGRGQSLLATVGFLYSELTRPNGLPTMPTACHELEAVLMTQLLMTAPNQLSPVLHGNPAPPRQSRIRDVMEYVDANPAAITSIADLAAQAGLSARALQAGFQDVAGVSPAAYVRQVRLDRAHRELTAGTGGSVTEVAARWGFFHLSRFAAQYRRRFGVLPSETARKAGLSDPP